MLCLGEKTRLGICNFLGKLGTRNNGQGMKSWSMITNRRGEMEAEVSKEDQKRLKAQYSILWKKTPKKLYIFRRIPFIAVECFLKLRLISVNFNDRKK